MGREGLMFVFAKEEMFKKEILRRLIPSSSTILDTILLAGGLVLPCFSIELALTQAQVETQEEEEQSLLPPHRKIKARERKLNRYNYPCKVV